MNTIRSFLAIEIPKDILASIETVQDELKRIGSDTKWVRPQSIHLTMKFFGDIYEEDIERIAQVIHPLAARYQPFELTLCNLGTFPDGNRPRVVWLGITSCGDMVLQLQQEIEDTLSAIGFLREKRPFSPHLTLGRVKGRKNVARLVETIQMKRTYKGGCFLVDKLILFKSDLRPTGALYTPLKCFNLKND
ncbi:MAG: RNA 2',3'-cyclic phosphodiesterase [Thermodesulfobacteriota bacterium]|nr:RNA 2',3'-cyclic phosphodiesterase [Thermodesulfobacteriota bacterium]